MNREIIDKNIKELREFTNNIDFENKNLNEIVSYIQFISRYCGNEYLNTFERNINQPLILHRAVKYKGPNAEYKRIHEIWSPDSKFVKFPGRVNFENRSIFYCSDIPATSIFELKPNLGDRIALITIKINRSIKLMSFGFQQEFEERNYSNKEVAMNLFIKEIFCESIPEDKPNLYLKTAVISNLFYPNEIDGFVFPSVATKLLGTNYAIKNEVLENEVEVIETRIFDVTEYISNLDFVVTCRLSAKEKFEKEFIWDAVKNCKSHKINELIYENE